MLRQLCTQNHQTYQTRQCLCDLDVYLPLIPVHRRAANYFAEEQNIVTLYPDNRAMSHSFTRDQPHTFACEDMENARNPSAFSAAVLGDDFNRSG